jgi:hypothetical protein
MRALPWLLQIAIFLFGGASLLMYANSDHFRLVPFLAMATFFLSLSLFTAIVDEFGDSRFIQESAVTSKVAGLILAVLSAGSFTLAMSILKGFQGGLSRHGALLRATIEVFGSLPPAGFFLLSGLVLARLSYAKIFS